MAQVVSTNCSVEIVAPTGRRWTFAQRQASEQALLAVETQKDMSQAVGSFTLHFLATLDQEGRRWDQIIPRRSLVTIRMEGPGGGPRAGINPTVMVGLTDDHAMQESWSEAQPRRTVVVRGREISSLILDAQLWFHPALMDDPRSRTINVKFQPMFDPKGPTLQTLAVTYNAELIKAEEDPRDMIKRVLEVFLFQGGAAIAPAGTPEAQQLPVISLDLPGTTIAHLLRAPRENWTLFEPATVHLPQVPASVGSIWNLLHLYIDRNFQEFFTRIEDGVCVIHFRGKPFKHQPIVSGTRFKGPDEQEVVTLQTLVLNDQDLLAQQLQCQTSNVYNVFTVSPLGMTDLFNDPAFLYKVMPHIILDPRHPSFVGRYGLRIMPAQSMYLSPLSTPGLARSKARVDHAPPTQPLTQPQPNAASYAAQANQIAAQHGIPPEQRPWFCALLHQESSWNPNATNTNPPTPSNPKGSVDKGLAQFHEPYPTGVTLVNPYDPEESMHAAAQYWNILRRTPGIGDDPVKIVSAYNAGPTGLLNNKGIPPNPTHVAGVTSHVAQYQHFAGDPVSSTPPVRIVSPAQRGDPQDFPEMIEAAKRWATILGAWYDMGGELFGGNITIRGHPAWNIGHRLLTHDERGEWEAYIEGVSHRYDMRTGQYLTTLRVTRGWYLSPAIAAQLWAEGQTSIEKVTGGPPPLSPAFGLETEDARGAFLSMQIRAEEPVREMPPSSGRTPISPNM